MDPSHSSTLRRFIKALHFPGVQALTIKFVESHGNMNYSHEDLSDFGSDDEHGIEDEVSDETGSLGYLTLHSCLKVILSSATDCLPHVSELIIVSDTLHAYAIPFQQLPNLRYLHVDVCTFSRFGASSSIIPALEAPKVSGYIDVRWIKHIFGTS